MPIHSINHDVSATVELHGTAGGTSVEGGNAVWRDSGAGFFVSTGLRIDFDSIRHGSPVADEDKLI